MKTLSIIIPEVPKGVSLPLALIELDHALHNIRLKSIEMLILTEDEEAIRQIVSMSEFLPDVRHVKKDQLFSEVNGKHIIFTDIGKGFAGEQLKALAEYRKSDFKCAIISPKKNESFLHNIFGKITGFLLGILKIKPQKGVSRELLNKEPERVSFYGMYLESVVLENIKTPEFKIAFFDLVKNGVDFGVVEIDGVSYSVADHVKIWREMIKHSLNNKLEAKDSNV